MADNKKTIFNRALAFYLLIIVGMIAVFIKALVLKVVEGPIYVNKQRETTRSDIRVPAMRGDILAKDGRTLACSVPYYKVIMDPCAAGLKDKVFNEKIDSLARKLSAFYGDKSAEEYKKMITNARRSGRQYLVINKRRISYTDLKIVKDFPIFKLGKNKGGFMYEESNMRKMPFGMLAGRTIGKLYKDKERGGMLGLELTYDEELRGKDGISNEVRIGGRWVPREIVAPEDGRSVVTTIDIDIQDVAESSLKSQLEKYDADHGVAILMEVKTGAIRAIVNLHKQDGTYSEDFFNYAIGEASEPGSTFKLATTMVLLEDGMIKDVDKDTINIFNGAYNIKDRVMRDSHKEDNPIVSIAKAFEISSNIAFSRLAIKHYGDDPQRFVDRLRDLGLSDSLGIELYGEGMTHIKNYREQDWSGISLPWMSIGYEVMITPLHLLTLYNSVANGGTMMRPMFVEGIMDHGEMVEVKRPKVLRNSIASKKTIETVKKMLERVVQNGTAKNIKDTKGYRIAGKTGTAQIAVSGKGYSDKGAKKYLASFAGYFPADEPMYSCIVSVSGPNNVYYGNVVAGTVVKDIADRVYAAEFRKGELRQKEPNLMAENYPYSKGGNLRELKKVFSKLNISHNVDVSTQWVSTTAQENNVKISPRAMIDGVMPDVRGMGATDAVNLLESNGLKVQLSGYGRVSTQSIPQGTKFVKGSTVFIELKI
ncbi:MAG: transpeptidase family protein [Bacteroidales bacterium]|nr:transpeptidase family protein [Bacteroidales bacterium]